MKKLLAMLTAVISICAFTGCSDSKDENKDFTSSGKSSAADEKDSGAEDKKESNNDDAGSSSGKSFDDFEFGSIDGNVYSSPFSGLCFTAPEGWEYSSQEQILQMMNLGTDMLGDKGELYKTIAQQTSIYEMHCINPISGDNMIIMYENLNAYANIADSFDNDSYLDAVMTQFEALEASGIIHELESKENVTVAGKEFLKADFNCTNETYGYSTSQSYYIAKDGEYMTILLGTLGTASELDSISELESCFSPYNE